MSDDTPTPPASEPPADDWKAPANQDELNKIVESRLARERARFADYDDIKAKAAEFDKAQEKNKTELEKATERAAKAEAAAETARLESIRASVALTKGLTPSQAKRLVGATQEELEADADELLADIAQGNKPKAPAKPPGGSGAASGRSDDDPNRALVRQLFGSSK